ncbi:MAG: hypothetical protein EA402_05625 [Planctomycetota bacterium]|nr:MAG: hypothetical protein EA402_05625 [Planctomycetota bacterium]
MSLPDWNLSAVVPILHPQARRAIEARDVVGLVCSTDSHRGLWLLTSNRLPALACGMWEEMLIEVWTCELTGRYSAAHWESVFRFGGRESRGRLRAIAPLPDMQAQAVTLYRGTEQQGDKFTFRPA